MSIKDELRMKLAGIQYESLSTVRTNHHGLDGDATVVRLRDTEGKLHDLTMFIADANKVNDEFKATLVASKVKSFLEGSAEAQ